MRHFEPLTTLLLVLLLAPLAASSCTDGDDHSSQGGAGNEAGFTTAPGGHGGLGGHAAHGGGGSGAAAGFGAVGGAGGAAAGGAGGGSGGDGQGGHGATTGQSCADAADLSQAVFPFQLLGAFEEDPAVQASCADEPAVNGVWFRFTAPADGYFELEATNATTTDAYSRLVVFESDSCDPLGTELACAARNAASASTLVTLVKDTDYLVLFHTDDDVFPMVDPSVSITPVTVGAGQACGTALTLTEDDSPMALAGDFPFDPSAAGSCDASPTNALWLAFTPADDGLYELQATNATDAAHSRLAIFAGAECDPLGSEVLCEVTTDSTIQATIDLLGSVTYLAAFYTDDDTYPMVSPTVSVTRREVGEGESCTSAVSLDGQTMPYELAGTFGVDPSVGSSCDGSPTNAAWLSFSPDTTGWYQIDALDSASGGPWLRLVVLEGSCAPLGPELDCVASTSPSASATVPLVQGQRYLLLLHTESDASAMVDPVVSITPTTEPEAGLDCLAPAALGAPSYYVGASGEDCWSWGGDPADAHRDHVFGCDSLTGGDVVVRYTTGSAQASLQIDAQLADVDTGGYIDVEVTEEPCTSGASVVCSLGDPATSYQATIDVAPSTSYLVWVADGFGGNSRPGVTLCLASP